MIIFELGNKENTASFGDSTKIELFFHEILVLTVFLIVKFKKNRIDLQNFVGVKKAEEFGKKLI